MTYDEAEKLIFNAGHYVTENADEIIEAIKAESAREAEERIAAWARKEGAVIRTEIGWVDGYDSARGVPRRFEERSVAEAIRAGEHNKPND